MACCVGVWVSGCLCGMTGGGPKEGAAITAVLSGWSDVF